MFAVIGKWCRQTDAIRGRSSKCIDWSFHRLPPQKNQEISLLESQAYTSSTLCGFRPYFDRCLNNVSSQSSHTALPPQNSRGEKRRQSIGKLFSVLRIKTSVSQMIKINSLPEQRTESKAAKFRTFASSTRCHYLANQPFTCLKSSKFLSSQIWKAVSE